MCRGTGAVPVAATDSGEAQTVPRLTKRVLVISREACCDSVKKHRANRVPFEKRYGRFTDRPYRWSALDKALLLEPVPGSRNYCCYQNVLANSFHLISEQMTQRCCITVYLYLGAYLQQCYVLYVEWITFIFPGHWNIRYDSYSHKCDAISPHSP